MDPEYMTTNKITSKCPKCGSNTADVLGLATSGKNTTIIIKCIPKNHQYTLGSKDKNTKWKKFFKNGLT